MKKLLALTLIMIIFSSCNNARREKTERAAATEFQEVRNDGYELSKPTKGLTSVLVLFGGYSETVEDIRQELDILELAMKNGIAVVFMNYQQKMWLEENEEQKLAEQLENIFNDHALPNKAIYFGGFSSGGNVALLISDFLINQNSECSPKGVFVLDSPVDLMALFRSADKNIARNFSEISSQESNWLLQTLGEKFGNPRNNTSKYEAFSVYTAETKNIDNIRNLKNTKIRFYTEPDTIWWKEHRMADYDQMNAYYLKQLSETLIHSDFDKVAYIPTENKGYRANGERHPHSWSIVDKKDLIKWILK